MKKLSLETYLAIIAVICIAVVLRLLPHSPNVAPIAALALFSGAMIPDRKGFIIPIVALLISDLFLGFHATMPFVYGSFLAIALMGTMLKKDSSLVKTGATSIIGSILFFLVTNFGVWATSSMYERSFSGLMRSYQMGIPFFRNTLLGDLFYTALFFFAYRSIRLLFVLMLPLRRYRRRRHLGNTV